jgi:hypothetical protein
MTREVLIGFDSAWTDSSRSPGAAVAYVIEGGNARPFSRRALPRSGTRLNSLGNGQPRPTTS